jgi:hypothetical protein
MKLEEEFRQVLNQHQTKRRERQELLKTILVIAVIPMLVWAAIIYYFIRH